MVSPLSCHTFSRDAAYFHYAHHAMPDRTLAALPMNPASSLLPSLPTPYRALVIGHTGGLGSAFIEHLRADPRCSLVVGIGRRAGGVCWARDQAEGSGPHAPAVSGLLPEGLHLDLGQEASISAAAQALRAWGPWHLILVATGVLHEGAAIQPEKRLADLQAGSLRAVLEVNTVGPAMVLRHFGPQLERTRSLMGLLSAKVGSIGDNRLGGWYAYRASKAALNMLVKTASIELRRTHPGAVLASLHPGTVRSGLSRPFRGDEIGRPAEAATADLLHQLDRLTADDTGTFLAYDGQRLPW